MEKNIYLHDYLASRILSFGKELDNYYLTYYKVNEDLETLYNISMFEGKDVLSVMGSCDQPFTSMYLKAANVDTFDMNRLSLYYYYLRKWSIKYMDTLYPLLDSYPFMTKMLSQVEPTSEFESIALDFYKKHVSEDTKLIKMFYEVDIQPKGNTIYQSASPLKNIIQDSINFYEMNLFEESGIDKTYDIIIISNILEWARNDYEKISMAKYNLNKLLNKDGIVICSALLNRPDSIRKKEYDFFSPDFEVEVHPECKNYLYIKK